LASLKFSETETEELYWAYIQLKTRQAFMNFFINVLNNYLGFFVDVPEDANIDRLSSREVFNFDAYLSNFEDKKGHDGKPGIE